MPASNVPGASPEGLPKVPTSFRGPSGESQVTNTKIGDLITKSILRSNSRYITYLFLFFNRKSKYLKSLNGHVQGISKGPSCATSQGPNDETF